MFSFVSTGHTTTTTLTMTGNTKSNKDGQDEAPGGQPNDDDGEGQSRKKSSSKNVDDAESCSTGGGSTSEEGKRSSRGGGGGYSADCSASDQSSDDAGGGAIQLSVEQLTLNGQDTDSRQSSPTNEEDSDEQSQQLPVDADADANGPFSSRAAAAAAKKRGTHAHHHNSRRYPSKKGAGARKSEGGAAGEGQASSHHHHHHRVDINAILNSKTRSENEDAAMMLLQGQKFLPQWRGVRVTHTMDPRIDLSSVSVLPGDAVPVASGALHTTVGKALTQMQKTAAAATSAGAAAGASSANEAAAAAAESSVHHHQVVEAEPLSVDSYVHLMEVRVFLPIYLCCFSRNNHFSHTFPIAFLEFDFVYRWFVPFFMTMVFRSSQRSNQQKQLQILQRLPLVQHHLV